MKRILKLEGGKFCADDGIDEPIRVGDFLWFRDEDATVEAGEVLTASSDQQSFNCKPIPNGLLFDL